MNFDRIDTWVFRVGIAVPAICVVGLLLWHLAGYLMRGLPQKRRRLSPEPPARADAVNSTPADPEALERACAAQAERLAELYLKLAESWHERGDSERATAAWQKVIERCPETRPAQIARERLQQMTAIQER